MTATLAVSDAVAQRVEELRDWARTQLTEKVFAVASGKGGVGKSFLAAEIAYALDAVLVDFDWNDGNVSRALGILWENRVRSPLLDAFESGRTPRPIKGRSRPDLIPGSPDFGANQPTGEEVRDALRQWAAELGRPIVVDCHPGDGDAAFGAMSAADLIVTPVMLDERGLDALNGWCRTFDGYPLLVAPNQTPKKPPGRQTDRLELICRQYGVPVAPPIPHQVWVPRRVARTTLLSSKASARTLSIQTALLKVAREVGSRAI